MLVLPVGGGERLRDCLLVENEIEEREERLVSVREQVIVWGERWGAANAIELEFKELGARWVKLGMILPVEDIRCGMRQTESVLNV